MRDRRRGRVEWPDVARKRWTVDELIAGVRGGDRRALARAISYVENADPLASPLVRALYPETGKAAVIGVTVFIRSMGSRGHRGGLAEATLQAVLLLDAAGKDVVFVETVGAGQSDVEVTGIADTVLLVLMPGSGDSVQALKAGIMEIPDVIAVNKSDHPAAKTMLTEVRSIVALGPVERRPQVLLTDALRGENVPALWGLLETDRASLERDGLLDERRRENLAAEVFAVASSRARSRLEEQVADDPELRSVLAAVQRRELDPLTAVDEILEKVFHLDRSDDR